MTIAEILLIISIFITATSVMGMLAIYKSMEQSLQILVNIFQELLRDKFDRDGNFEVKDIS